MTTAEAQEYLELIQTLPAEHVGPLLRVQDRSLDLRRLIKLSTLLNQAVMKVDEKTYRAPSPWHAAAWLLDVARLVAMMRSENPATGLSSPVQAERGALIFRG